MLVQVTCHSEVSCRTVTHCYRYVVSSLWNCSRLDWSHSKRAFTHQSVGSAWRNTAECWWPDRPIHSEGMYVIHNVINDVCMCGQCPRGVRHVDTVILKQCPRGVRHVTTVVLKQCPRGIRHVTTVVLKPAGLYVATSGHICKLCMC
jgi:hypothetical protein